MNGKKKMLIFYFIFCFYFIKAQFTTLHSFGNSTSDGIIPLGSLITDGNYLYGMTNGGGAGSQLNTGLFGSIFKVKTDGTGYLRLMSFYGSNGAKPYGSLVFDGTYLYGMTATWNSTLGTIFKILPNGSGYIKLLDFNGQNGSDPRGSLIFDGTYLYGITKTGGLSNLGLIFKIKPDGSNYTILKNFSGTPDGQYPEGSLVFDGTFLYGMTHNGGINNSPGIIFKIKPDGSGYVKILDFAGTSNGANPSGSLIYDGTFFYGMTENGGSNNKGVIFKILGDGSNYSLLFDFSILSNGWRPHGDLISTGNFFYGMTKEGGSNNDGVLFKIKSDGTSFSKILDFGGSTYGINPHGSLIHNGTSLFGMTALGGQFGLGKIFKYDGVVDVEEKFNKTNFTISPNPNNGEFTLELNNYYKEFQIEVFNFLGELVFKENITPINYTFNNLNVAQTIINLTSQSNGIYSVSLKLNDLIITKKIIINR
jgi:uncharacterized repeat protein (TIGR03803 family)